MSTSDTSLKRCFCRLFMMEKAIESVSSAVSRCASMSGCSSPFTRMNGKLPALMWRSDAPLLHAAASSSSILTVIVLLALRVPGVGHHGDSTLNGLSYHELKRVHYGHRRWAR